MAWRQNADEIKALLNGRLEDLAARLCPDGRRSGKYWIGKSPVRADRNAGSFWINLHGPMTGTYHDRATGETGDMLALIQGVFGYDFNGALEYAADFLGLAQMPEAERRERIKKVEEGQQEADRTAGADAERHRKWAFGVFVSAKKEHFLGSPADRYLRSRGIDLQSLGRMPGALGWLPAMRHRESGTQWPVMVAGFTCPQTLKIVAVHRTWLTPEGGKAPVVPVRKIFPGYGGAAIRVWRGENKMTPEKAGELGLLETLVLTEGVEDALSIVRAQPHYRVWAVGALNNLAAVKIPKCCDRVIVCKDNDWGKRSAQALFDKGVAWLMRQGAEVSVASSPIGKDVNDALRGAI